MRFGAAVLAIAGLAFAPAGAAVNPGVGVVPRGFITSCDLARPVARLEFDFAGRMPAGTAAYTVTSGRATAAWDCFTSPNVPLRLTGQTPSGRFEWLCAGGVWLEVQIAGLPPQFSYRGLCRTLGLPGRFELVVVMQAIQDRAPSPLRQRWTVTGAYVTGPPALEAVFRSLFGDPAP